MGATKYAFRIIEKRGSRDHRLVEGGWNTQREARAVAVKMGEAADLANHYPTRRYRVVASADLRGAVVKLKASSVKAYLGDKNFQCAVDFEDAQPRLAKMARNIENYITRNQLTGPRKGWLASKAGIVHLYEVVTAASELRRIQYGNYTADENARIRGSEGAIYDPYSSTRTQITEEAKEALRKAYHDLAEASIHSDEW
jgi:hypothetical protein